MAPKFNTSAYARAKAEGYRSGLETRNAKRLDDGGYDYEYEAFKVPFMEPAKKRTYLPDFILPNGIVIDTKGRWVTADRQKFKMLVEQHPAIDFRMVFSNPNTKIGKTSKTTYGMYAAALGLPFAKEFIPKEWIEEPRNEASLAAIESLIS